MLNYLPDKKILIFIVALAVILFLGVLGWYFYKEKEIAQKLKEAAKEETKFKAFEELEKQIAATKEELKKIESLSPEERQKREKERGVLTAQKAEADVKIEGVEVVVSAKEKIIKNNSQGYSLRVPLNLVLARSISSDELELHDSKTMCQDPSCEPVMRIAVSSINQRALALDEWFKDEERKASNEIYSPRERLTFGNQTVYRVSESVPPVFDGYYYYWGGDNKIYSIRISKFDDDFYRPYIATFELE